jgi:diaminopimelate epimerase
MRLRFTKMHGLGNDFVVIDAINQRVDMTPQLSRRLADRRFGIGCDQLLLVEAPRLPRTEFHYRIFNADGSEVEQCGNGARCFARFVRDQGLTRNHEIAVGTAAGVIKLSIQPDGQVSVDMCVPRLDPAEIPFEAKRRAAAYDLGRGCDALRIGAVSMGNPHAVLRVTSVDDGSVERLGAAIESHPDFPERVNAGFMQILDRENIRLRVYERGAGETLACGSGACAAVVHGQRMGWLDERVTVDLPGGKLTVAWEGDDSSVLLTGPTAISFEGSIRL